MSGDELRPFSEGRKPVRRTAKPVASKPAEKKPYSAYKPTVSNVKREDTLWTPEMEQKQHEERLNKLYGKQFNFHWANERAKADVRKKMSAIQGGREAPDLRSKIGTSLRDELKEERPEVRHAIDGLAKTGSIVTLPSNRKTGKTTFLGNLAVDGVTGSPFLGKFDTHLGDWDVCIINAEMTKDDYLDVYRDMDPGEDKSGEDPYKRIHFLHCREEGIRLNLLDDGIVNDFIGWLHWNCGKWLFLDPWKNICSWAGIGINDNAGVNDLLIRIQAIQAQAELDLVVIPMHTPQSTFSPNGAESDEGRGKGAGELEDGADALWRYIKKGKGPSAPRFISAVGRGGVSLDETEVLFDVISQRLTLGDKNHADAVVAGDEQRVLRNLRESETGDLATTGLYKGMGTNRGVVAKDSLAGKGLIEISRKIGNTVYWKEPEQKKLKVTTEKNMRAHTKESRTGKTGAEA